VEAVQKFAKYFVHLAGFNLGNLVKIVVQDNFASFALKNITRKVRNGTQSLQKKTRLLRCRKAL